MLSTSFTYETTFRTRLRIINEGDCEYDEAESVSEFVKGSSEQGSQMTMCLEIEFHEVRSANTTEINSPSFLELTLL